MQRVLNTEQREAVQHGKGPLLIIAGAGSGKTTVVTERVKYLILKKGLSLSEILALTFTEAGAAAMRGISMYQDKIILSTSDAHIRAIKTLIPGTK